MEDGSQKERIIEAFMDEISHMGKKYPPYKELILGVGDAMIDAGSDTIKNIAKKNGKKIKESAIVEIMIYSTTKLLVTLLQMSGASGIKMELTSKKDGKKTYCKVDIEEKQ